MPVPTLASVDPHQLFNLSSRSDAERHRLDTRVSGIAVSNDFSGRFSVTTAEGDRITLTANLESYFRSGSYASPIETDRGVGSADARSTHYTHRQGVGIAVEGNLSEEELQDLELLFQKIGGVFRGLIHGPNENAEARTAKLAEGFRELDTLSALNLSIEVVRSIAVVAASRATPGGAPGTAVAIPQPSNGTTAPTPLFEPPDGTRLNEPVNDAPLASLVQQVLDVLKAAKVESDKVRQYLPDFLDKLHEDLIKELRGEQEHETTGRNRAVAQQSGEVESPANSHNLFVVYDTAAVTSLSLSIQV